MKKILVIVVAMLALSGCATHMENVNPAWNPPKGQEEADAKCQAGAKYAWDKFGSYAACMAKFGYERRPGPKTTG